MPSLENFKPPSLQVLKQASSGALDKAKLMVGLKQQQEGDDGAGSGDVESQQESQDTERSSVLEDVGEMICPDLTFQQRLIGFAVCFLVGYMITFLSFKFFVELIEGHPVPFALNYTGGNLLSLGASWFLCGPKRQFRNMFDSKRKWTSVTYLSCMGSTLVLVFIPCPWGLRLLLLISLLLAQFIANLWYSLSYIPYGRRTALRMFKRILGLNEQPVEGIAMPTLPSLSSFSGRNNDAT